MTDFVDVVAAGLDTISPHEKIVIDLSSANTPDYWLMQATLRRAKPSPLSTQEDNTMQEGLSNINVPEQPKAPQSPPEHFAGAANSVDCALQELSHIVSVLIGDDMKEGDAQPTGPTGRQTPSVMQIVRVYPDELETAAKRIHREVERLRDAFLTP